MIFDVVKTSYRRRFDDDIVAKVVASLALSDVGVGMIAAFSAIMMTAYNVNGARVPFDVPSAVCAIQVRTIYSCRIFNLRPAPL